MKIKNQRITLMLAMWLFAALLVSCEKDDSCIDPTTPNLVIQFYDYDSPENVKSIANLNVVYLETGDTLKFQNVDEIKIPLNVNDDSCLLKLVKDTASDMVSFTYQREYVFVSKACGFKTLFHNLEMNVSHAQWIKDFEIINHEIVIDTSAHVKIFH